MPSLYSQQHTLDHADCPACEVRAARILRRIAGGIRDAAVAAGDACLRPAGPAAMVPNTFPGLEAHDLPQPQQHTLGHLDCSACQAASTSAPTTNEDLRRQRFGDAWRDWLGERRRIAPGTRATYKQYFQPLDATFGHLRLEEIGREMVEAYRKRRRDEITAWRRERDMAVTPESGASRINHEISSLGLVLKRAALWDIKRFYEPMRLPHEGPGIALTEEEERHLFRLARSKSRWLVAYCCHLISMGTTAGPSEIRCLRVRDVDLEARAIMIRQSVKTDFRYRALPIEGDALSAAQQLLERYRLAMRTAGIAESPDHYILYHRAHTLGAPPDPARPMGSWKRAHRALRAEAAKRYPRLATLRSYDMRHTAATKMLEDPEIPYSTIERFMGHRLGSRTKQIYDHVRDATMRKAAHKLDGGHAAAADHAEPATRAGLANVRKPPRATGDQASNLARNLMDSLH